MCVWECLSLFLLEHLGSVFFCIQRNHCVTSNNDVLIATVVKIWFTNKISFQFVWTKKNNSSLKKQYSLRKWKRTAKLFPTQKFRVLVSVLVFFVNRFMSLSEFSCRSKWSQTFLQSALGPPTSALFINGRTLLLRTHTLCMRVCVYKCELIDL